MSPLSRLTVQLWLLRLVPADSRSISLPKERFLFLMCSLLDPFPAHPLVLMRRKVSFLLAQFDALRFIQIGLYA